MLEERRLRHARVAATTTATAGAQTVEFAATDKQVADARRRRHRRRAAADRQAAWPSPRRSGDSPNPFFNVYRSYSEPGRHRRRDEGARGRQPGRDEARADRHVDARQADLRDQDDRRTRATCPTARATRCCSRPINHAREWIAAEMGRRLPGWFAEHKNDPKISELIRTRELWFLPIQNPDGYDYTFTCGEGSGRGQPSRATTARSHRRRRPTASGARRSATTTPTASTATARTASTRTATTRPSAASTRRARPTASASGTYRGPYALSEPENLAVDRLQRRVHVHGQHQLPLGRPAAADPGVLHDRLLPAGLDAVRRHHRHRRRRGRLPVPLAALVGPLRVQRRHDRQRLHELRHHRLDAGDGHLRHDGRARRLQPASRRPDNESKVKAVFDKNLAFALNVDRVAAEHWAVRRTSTTTRASTRSRPTAGHPAQPLRRLLRRDARSIEATIRKELGDADITRQRRRRRTATSRSR